MSENLGQLCDQIYKMEDKLEVLRAKLKEAEGEKRALENRLMLAMREVGTDAIRGKVATAGISTVIRGNISNFAELEPFVYRNKALHLFERRISAVSYREMMELRKGKAIPGLSTFEQVRLNIRKLT